MTERSGFRYVIDDETLLKYLQVPIEQRLEWLEEANRFLLAVMPASVRDIWEKFRRGQI